MNSSPAAAVADPSVHRQREQRLVEHVQRLLDDERFRLDTTKGAKSVVTLVRDVGRFDGGVELTRLMSDMGVPDRDLRNRMPVGEGVEVTLAQKRWFVLREVVGRLRVVCTSPVRQLLKGEPPEPMDTGALNKVLAAQPPSLGGVPQTILVMSTSGFTLEAHEVADRRADRTVILIEPNEAGGWTVTGPTVMKSLTDLLDPERDEEKRQRVRDHVEANRHELAGSGLAADRIAAKTQLSPPFVEAELKAYARANPGLQAKRLDGRMVLFREGSVAASDLAGGANMPFMEKIRAIFQRADSPQQKIARLTTERVTLSQQREHIYDHVAALEQKEAELTARFERTTPLGQRRIAGEIAQLRADADRRQQLLSTLDRKITVINSGIHKLEMEQQVAPDKLKPLEGLTGASDEMEAGLAALEQLEEDADALSELAGLEPSQKVQSVLDELLAKKANPAPADARPADDTDAQRQRVNAPGQQTTRPKTSTEGRTAAKHDGARKAEPEAG